MSAQKKRLDSMIRRPSSDTESLLPGSGGSEKNIIFSLSFAVVRVAWHTRATSNLDEEIGSCNGIFSHVSSFPKT
eukprot:3444123-Rhodomonas_salina.1